MKKIAEKQIYIMQIIIFVITVIAYLAITDVLIRYIVLLGAVSISVVLVCFNIFVLGKRNEQK